MRLCLRIVRRLFGGRGPVAMVLAIPVGGLVLDTFEPWRPGL